MKYNQIFLATSFIGAILILGIVTRSKKSGCGCEKREGK